MLDDDSSMSKSGDGLTEGAKMGEWDNDDGWDEAGLAAIDALEQQAVLGEPPRQWPESC